MIIHTIIKKCKKNQTFFLIFHLNFLYEMVYSIFGTRCGILFFCETNAKIAFQIGFWPKYKALPHNTSDKKSRIVIFCNYLAF